MAAAAGGGRSKPQPGPLHVSVSRRPGANSAASGQPQTGLEPQGRMTQSGAQHDSTPAQLRSVGPHLPPFDASDWPHRPSGKWALSETRCAPGGKGSKGDASFCAACLADLTSAYTAHPRPMVRTAPPLGCGRAGRRCSSGQPVAGREPQARGGLSRHVGSPQALQSAQQALQCPIRRHASPMPLGQHPRPLRSWAAAALPASQGSPNQATSGQQSSTAWKCPASAPAAAAAATQRRLSTGTFQLWQQLVITTLVARVEL